MSNPNYVPLPPNPAQPGGDQHDSDPYQQTPGAQPTAPAYGQVPAAYAQPAQPEQQPAPAAPTDDDDVDATVLGSVHTPAAAPTTAQPAPAYGQPAPAAPADDDADATVLGSVHTPAAAPAAQPAADSQNAFSAVPPAPGPDPSSQFPPAPNMAPPAPAPNAYAAPAGLYRSDPSLDEPYYGCPIFEAYIRFWKQYVVFSGRASRSEFWWPFLCNIVIGGVLGFLVGVIYNATGANLGFLTTVYGLACFIPGLSLGVRRLHDTNRPGWWLAIIYGLLVLGFILVIAGGGALVFGGLGYAFSGGSGYGATAASGGALMIFGLLVELAGAVLWIVLMALPSNPEGARFDKHAAASPYGTPAAGAPNAAPVYSTSTPGYGAAPVPPAAPAPFGAPAPAAPAVPTPAYPSAAPAAPTPATPAPADPFAVPAPSDPFAVPAVPDVPSAAPAPASGTPAPDPFAVPAPGAPAPQQSSDTPATQPADDDMDATVLGHLPHSDTQQTPQAPYAQPGQQPWQGK